MARQHRGDLRAGRDAAVDRHRVHLVERRQPTSMSSVTSNDVVAGRPRVAHDEQKKPSGCVRWVGEERAHELGRRRPRSRSPPQLASGARLGRLVFVDHAGRQLGDDLAAPCLYCRTSSTSLVRRQRADDAEAARLAHEVVVDDDAAGQLDAVRAQAARTSFRSGTPKTGCAMGAAAARSCLRVYHETMRKRRADHATSSGEQDDREDRDRPLLRHDVRHLWKDGTYFPRGTRVLVTGLHLEQGFCVRFPAERRRRAPRDVGGLGRGRLSRRGRLGGIRRRAAVARPHEAREVLDEAEDGCHLHLHEGED